MKICKKIIIIVVFGTQIVAVHGMQFPKKQQKQQSLVPHSQTISSSRKKQCSTQKNYRLYILLDVPDVNHKQKPIQWQKTINRLTSHIDQSLNFIPEGYPHISLVWYESEEPLSGDSIAKLKRALADVRDILKDKYPNGICGISFLDGAMMIGKHKNVVAFKVALSDELKKVQTILLKRIALENIEGFKANGSDGLAPLHVTLGRIYPEKQGKKCTDLVQGLFAPMGASDYHGQSFVANILRVSQIFKKQRRQQLAKYVF